MRRSNWVCLCLCLCSYLFFACESNVSDQPQGELCPPSGEAMSSACLDNPEACHYHSEIGRCEDNYMCVPDPADASGLTFECNKDCPDTQKLCSVEGGPSVCADTQTDAKHCGDCNKSCNDGEPCDGGKCGCSKAKAFCNNACIEPLLDQQYCGAKAGGNCDSEDPNSADYKGEACSSAQMCKDGKCICNKNAVLCNGSCIDPKSSNTHCGAKGNCTGNVSTANDFAGDVCENGRTCLAGLCACPSGFVLCDGNCIDPQLDNNFCGAKGACTNTDASHADYKGMQCAEHSACVEGSCKVVSCEEGLRLCPSADGGNSCINVMGDDPNNCGSCGWKCKDHPMNGATSDTCLKGMCQYVCPTVNSTQNCGTKIEPLCLSVVDFDKNPKYCGSRIDKLCGVACKDDEPLCWNSECAPHRCPKADVCTLIGCQNEDRSCGRSCVDCTSLPNIHVDEQAGAAAKCVVDAASAAEGDTVGSCKISRCADGYHLNRKTSGNACVRNRVDKCAPPNQAEDGDNTDCRKIAGVALSACSPMGLCNALRCETNYHLLRDAELDVFTCVPNTDTACGAVDSVAVKNCEKLSADKPYHCRMGVCVYDQADGKWGEHELSQNIWCNSYYGAPTPCPYVEGKLRYCTREAGNTFGCGYLCVQGSNAEGAHNAVSCEGKCILFGDGASCDLCKNCNDGERCYKDSESGKVLCAACEDVCSAPQICTEDKTARFACTGCEAECSANDQCYQKEDKSFACTNCRDICPITQNCYQKDDGNFACTNCVPPCAEGERCYLNEQGKFACTECKQSCVAPEHCYFIKAKAESFVCR